ncbi:L-serine dehydratase [Zancudomyces culisetae]|uniref:L-serine dehydratase n=1 Tax=Zancudomyces culisetae TaxID=1213189 RepID=A0A1R1PWV6_ZANCU|nr:L-serine dehydratase [Zancudomyces culisetae]|eukprot:OMH85407.1 L-serine dehydratase [Zancudomyces culisetae]
MTRKGGLLVSGIASSAVESRNSYSSYSVAGQQYGQVGYTRRFNSTLEPVKNIKVEEQYQKEGYKDAEHHAVVSMFDLFSIGIGPSSSHTVGPMRAAKMFITSLEQHGVLKKVTRIKVTLYGSLALTGIGHGTPNAVLMGLEGESPESVETELISQRVEGIKKTETINLGGNHRVKFEVARDLELNGAVTLVQHPNGMRFSVFDGNGDMVATNERCGKEEVQVQPRHSACVAAILDRCRSVGVVSSQAAVNSGDCDAE